MCGIVGQFGGELDEAVLLAMAGRIAHRGPDDSGIWIDPTAGIGFGQLRLAIVDLGPSGHQPMHSASRRFTLNFNGEIYNHKALRARLEQERCAPEGGWRGHSDTEVLLAAIEAWGLEITLARAVGMFAFALWDGKARALILARDRFGEKPLYYAFARSGLLFASELSALAEHPAFCTEIAHEAVAALLRRNYIPAPLSIYHGCYKLLPGATLTLTAESLPSIRDRLTDTDSHGDISSPVQRFWDLQQRVAQGERTLFTSEEEALDALDAQFAETLREMHQADVPVGAFLSGGVDSSAVVALLQHHVGITAKTFTIGFTEPMYDESHHARAVARHLGTDHNELIVTPADAMTVIQELPRIYSEPFADSSQIPTFLVSRLARQHVTVALSGDAGDEMFGGYNRYVWANHVWSKLEKAPAPLRRAAGAALLAPPNALWRALSTIPGPLCVPGLDLKAQKIGRILRHADDADELYAVLLDEWPGGHAPLSQPSAHRLIPELIEPLRRLTAAKRMMVLDRLTYLPDDILAKVDRAAMAHGLETRVPMLDHRLAETAFRLPLSMMLRGDANRWALRQLLYRHVPRELIERPKAGFGIPVGEWIRGPLRGWAEDLLSERALRDNPYLDPRPIRRRWSEHLAGKADCHASLWAVLMLQAFLRR